jgi:hypothetical protein
MVSFRCCYVVMRVRCNTARNHGMTDRRNTWQTREDNNDGIYSARSG